MVADIHLDRGDDSCIYCEKQHPMGECPVLRAAERKVVAEEAADALVKQLGHFVNGMSHEQADAFATALANEHPTLLGQIAKAVGIGVMRRAVYDPAWKPFDKYERKCPGFGFGPYEKKPEHAEHDGRLSCDTVIGAELMAHQAFI